MGRDVTKPVAVVTTASATQPVGSVRAHRAGRGPTAQKVSLHNRENWLSIQEVYKRSQDGISCFVLFLFFLPECPAGFYGADCRQRCLCQNGATCSKTSGKCTCASGWTGTACELGKTQILWVRVTACVTTKPLSDGLLKRKSSFITTLALYFRLSSII